MSEEFGAGISFGEDFDFTVGPTGDLDTERGTDELQKDLAMQMVISLDQYVGQPPSGNLEAKVANTAAKVAKVDSRIESVNKETLEVEFSPSREEITIDMTVNTESGEQDLVFEV